MARHYALLLIALTLTTFDAGAAAKAAAKAAPKANSESTAKLLAASAQGDEDAILAAIAEGANVNARDADGSTPLILAAPQSLFGKERKIVEALVKEGAKVDAIDKDGATALMTAASAGRDGMVRLLLQNDAKVDLQDNDGWTALMYAASAGNSSVVKELIEAKADVNSAEKKGWTPLMMALSNGRGGVSEQLIKAGAKMPDKAPSGLSAALLATYGRDLAGVRQVLDAKVPLDGRDEDGWTALEVAAYKGDGQIVMELLRAGADPALKDKEGHTAVDRAKEEKHSEIVSLLSESWEPSRPKGGTDIGVPCPLLGGKIDAYFSIEGPALIVTTVFPRPMTYYLGGGNMNRSSSAKKFTYDGSFTPTYFFDTDSNAKTGMKQGGSPFKESIGSEYAIDYSQYGTSVTLEYNDSKGNARSKPVYANVLDVDIDKEGETVDVSDLGDERPRAINADGVLVTKIPLSLLKLTSGQTIRVTAKIGSCDVVVKSVRLQ